MKKNLHYLKKIASWLLTRTCSLCGDHSTRDEDICAPCYEDLPFLLNACEQCAKPLPVNAVTCGICLKHPPSFDRTFAAFIYQPPVTKLITNLKFGEKLNNARLLGELMTLEIQNKWYQHGPLPEVIIPVPLHSSRLKERGFNQAVEIAKPIAKKLRIPLAYSLCERVKATQAQAQLPANLRKANVRNAFRVVEHLSLNHVAVIDDVMTTGFTMLELCRTLKKSGVKTIDVWCCARPAF